MADLKTRANAVRMLAVEAVQKAQSGHPGAPLGMADVATVLWSSFLKFDATHPDWPDRDRFVLSAGHASAMLYSLLYLTGFQDATLDELKNFRQLSSKTAGHPEYGLLSGVEATTGPLGQGIGMGVGMALAEKILNARFGADLVNHYTYVMAGDGCLMEGVSEEAISLAGHLKLNKLIVFWDNNNVTIDGKATLASSTDQHARFKADGWAVLAVDGHDADAIHAAIAQARTHETPTLIDCKTTIGYGAPTKAGTSAAHGAPLGIDEINGLKQALHWPYDAFDVPPDVLEEWRTIGRRGEEVRRHWENRLNASPDKDEFLRRVVDNRLPDDIGAVWTAYKEKLMAEKPALATRKASQNALQVLVPVLPELVGGSADLSASNLTKTPDHTDIFAGHFNGNYVNYGIREHAMGAAMNGMALHGGIIPYGGTFLVFADYLKPALRLSALMKQRVIYVLTHDSIGVGEDGPTHQPIEQLAMIRATPNVLVFRPCDALETAESWETALKHDAQPSALILTRQALPFLRTSAVTNQTANGAYILSEAAGARDVTLIATGSEVQLAVEAQQQLKEMNIEAAVVSMPCQELFNQQPVSYQHHILGSAPRVAIEALSDFGWHRYADTIVSMTGFGASGPGPDVFNRFGITTAHVVEVVLSRLKEAKNATL